MSSRESKGLVVALVASDRRTTTALLAHIAEVDARELFLPEACSSMHVYCTRVLHLAEEVAFKRIRAARIARRFPQIFEAIADGRMHVSGVVMLAPHVTDENVDELIAAATHRSKTELETLIARLAPKPDVPTSITPIEPPQPPGEALQLDPDPVAPPAPPTTRVKPLAPERYELRLTIAQATRDKLDRAQALLRHQNPTGDLADVIDRALDALLAKIEKEKFAATSRPRARKARRAGAGPRYTQNAVKRAVHARDGEQCAFVSTSGERCTERRFLQLDHRTPVALGGQPTVDELRYLCHAHNQYEADRQLGADFMRAKREVARLKREEARAKRAATAPDRAATSALATTAPTTTAAPATTPESDPADARRFDADVTLALCGMGFNPKEVRRAIDETAKAPTATLEARLRAALAALSRGRGSRCSEGAFDVGPRGYLRRLRATIDRTTSATFDG